MQTDKQRFGWTGFYQAVADKLLKYENRRAELVDFWERSTTSRVSDDVCPFTIMALFNRTMRDDNRNAIAKNLADFLAVTETAPESFEGIPRLNNQNFWFFRFKQHRQPGDIDSLWEFFRHALKFSNSDGSDAQSFSEAYNRVAKQETIGLRKITTGLHWIRPWKFLLLDGKSQTYVSQELGIKISSKVKENGEDYLALLREIESRFGKDAFPVRSFPELSFAANRDNPVPGPEVLHGPIESYGLDNIVSDGCFLPREDLEDILGQLQIKKNVILQGPPGTGKTWLAKKLAYAIMGKKDEGRLRAVQFHPTLSYEDFIRGWRPSGEGKLSLVDGPFLEMIEKAKEEEEAKHVIVIEEINRGNPAQIFGEMLTLLEADKRSCHEALELSYRRFPGERVCVPENLYVIGTMNIADRSLALVDLALRRRFAFVNMEPIFGEIWKNWVHEESGIPLEFLEKIESRMLALNKKIENDPNLGAQFRVGHSYVTPSGEVKDASEWYRGVVETGIGPLLEEYWFDNLKEAQGAKEALLEGM